MYDWEMQSTWRDIIWRNWRGLIGLHASAGTLVELFVRQLNCQRHLLLAGSSDAVKLSSTKRSEYLAVNGSLWNTHCLEIVTVNFRPDMAQRGNVLIQPVHHDGQVRASDSCDGYGHCGDAIKNEGSLARHEVNPL